MFYPEKAEILPERTSRSIWPAVLQLGLVPLVMAGLVAGPPASGKMLVIPLGASAKHDLPRLAINSGAALVGYGPFKGSLVISGDRARVFGAIEGRPILVLSTAMPGCSGEKVA